MSARHDAALRRTLDASNALARAHRLPESVPDDVAWSTVVFYERGLDCRCGRGPVARVCPGAGKRSCADCGRCFDTFWAATQEIRGVAFIASSPDRHFASDGTSLWEIPAHVAARRLMSAEEVEDERLVRKALLLDCGVMT